MEKNKQMNPNHEHWGDVYIDTAMKQWEQYKKDHNMHTKNVWKVYHVPNVWEFVKNHSEFNIIDNDEHSPEDEWDDYFKDTENIKYYQTSYKIIDENDTTNTYELKLRVSKLEKGDFYAWDLVTDQMYRNTINSNNPLLTHPFDKIDDDDVELCTVNDKIFLHVGGINAKNDLMDCLFKMLMQYTDTLAKKSGNTDPEDYRSQMVCLFKMLMQYTDTLAKKSGNTDPEDYRSQMVKFLHDLWD